MNRGLHGDGFTLIELLVVSAIVAVIGGVIAACVAGGIRVWETIDGFNRVQTHVRIGLALVEKDLRNAFPVAAAPMKGQGDRVSFAGWRDRDAEGCRGIGWVTYSYDPARSAVIRTRQAYPAGESVSEEVVSDVASFRLSYSPASGNRSLGPWTEAWDSPTNFPCRILIELILRDGEALAPASRIVAPALAGVVR